MNFAGNRIIGNEKNRYVWFIAIVDSIIFIFCNEILFWKFYLKWAVSFRNIDYKMLWNYINLKIKKIV